MGKILRYLTEWSLPNVQLLPLHGKTSTNSIVFINKPPEDSLFFLKSAILFLVYVVFI